MHKVFLTNVSLNLIIQIPTMPSILDARLVFEVLMISSKHRLNRNIFNHNLIFSFFGSVMCEGLKGCEKNRSFEILRKIQPGTSSGPN